MGRQRKPLEEKTTPFMLRFNNKFLFELCDKHNIEVNKSGALVNDKAKKEIATVIKQNIHKLLL